MRSESFEQWFSDGGLANPDGEPVVLYHGAPRPEGLTRFVPGGPIGAHTTGDVYGVASYFTSSPAEASSYATLRADDEGAVLPVYVRGNLLDVDGPLTAEQQARLTQFAADVLLPSDKARFPMGRSERRFTGVQDARDFFDSQRKNWEVFGDGMERAKPEAIADGDAFVVQYTDFDANVRIETGAEAFTLFRSVGFDNLPAAGFDGMVMAREGGAKWVVMHRTDGNVKSAIGNSGEFNPSNPDIRFSLSGAPAKPVFYSSLARAISAAKNQQMPGIQWAAWLKANMSKLGLKKAEIEWSGVGDYLQLRAGERVSRDELMSFVADNGVRVEEAFNRDVTTVAAELEQRLGKPWSVMYDSVEKTMDFLNTENGEQYLLEELPQELRTKVEDLVGAGEARYSKYVVPGGENYRELLLTLPAPRAPHKLVARQSNHGYWEAYNSTEDDVEMEGTEDEIRAYVEETTRNLQGVTTSVGYRSSHWGAKNVVAHLRVDDRVDGDGSRVLFIHEVQSDWGQEGKRNGFAQPRWTSAEEARVRELESPRPYPGLSDAERDEFAALIAKRVTPGVASAPFVTETKAWVALALKRAILMAVEGGYDRVALINGEQAVGLYDLSKRISRVLWTTTKEQDAMGVGSLYAYGLDGREAINKVVKTDELGDHIGKEIAAKILALPKAPFREGSSTFVRSLEGLELKVGGEGMRTFYDEIVPQVMRDVVRKLGGDGVEPVVLDGGTPEITDHGRWFSVDGIEDDGNPKVFDTRHEAELAAKSRGTGSQSGFDITTALREKVLAGVPLFSLATTTAGETDELIDGPIYQEGAMGEGGFFRTQRTEEREAKYRALGLKPFPFGGIGEAWVLPHEAAFLEKHGFGGSHLNQSALHVLQVADAGLDPLIIRDRFVSEWVENLERDEGEGVEVFQQLRDAAMEFIQARQATPQSMRAAIADVVRCSPQELADSLGGIVVTTSAEWANKMLAPQETPAFKSWFANSKVVDVQGQPLKLYHATVSDFSEFGHTKDIGFHFGSLEQAHDRFSRVRNGRNVMPVYVSIQNPLRLTVDPRAWMPDYVVQNAIPAGVLEQAEIDAVMAASDEALKSARDESAEMNRQRQEAGKPPPKDDDWTSILYKHTSKVMASVRDILASKGYDGVVYTNRYEGRRSAKEDSWVAFRPEQIKSALGNRGTYDPKNPDIRHSLAGLDPRAQAWYDVATNTTVFLADRIPAGKEASVFLHEIVHRHGRQALPEGQWGALVGQVKAWAQAEPQSPERAIHDAAAARVATAGIAGALADEELFAYAVEEAVARGVQPTAAAIEGSAAAWLQAVVESIQRVSDKLLGNDLQELSGQDLVDLAYALAQLDSPEHGVEVRRALKDLCDEDGHMICASPGSAPVVEPGALATLAF